MFKSTSNKMFKIIFIFLITILILLIYFQNSFDKFNLKLSSASELKLKIQSLMNNKLNNEEMLSDLIEKESNVPFKYYAEWKTYPSGNQWEGTNITTCDTELPRIEEIDFNNIFWQTIPNTNKTQYFLYNAFYDNRGTDKYVRVVAIQREQLTRDLWSVHKYKQEFFHDNYYFATNK